MKATTITILIFVLFGLGWVAVRDACANNDCWGRRCLSAAACCPSSPRCYGEPAQWGHCQ